MTTFDKTLAAIFIPILAYLILVLLPVNLYAEAECLRKGYPASRVSVGLEAYCTTLDGAVTVTVSPVIERGTK